MNCSALWCDWLFFTCLLCSRLFFPHLMIFSKTVHSAVVFDSHLIYSLDRCCNNGQPADWNVVRQRSLIAPFRKATGDIYLAKLGFQWPVSMTSHHHDLELKTNKWYQNWKLCRLVYQSAVSLTPVGVVVKYWCNNVFLVWTARAWAPADSAPTEHLLYPSVVFYFSFHWTLSCITTVFKCRCSVKLPWNWFHAQSSSEQP